MASPQCENGYTRIAHELLEAVCRARLTGSEYMVFLWIARKSYGWNQKQTNHVGVRGMALEMAAPIVSVHRGIRLLAHKKIVQKTGDGIYEINKDYDSWSVPPAEQTVPPMEREVFRPLNESVPPMERGCSADGTRIRSKETNNKERKITTTPQSGVDGEIETTAKRTPFQVFMDWAISEFWGLKPGNQNPNERAKVTAAYRRYGRAVQEIMAYADQDPERAREGCKAIGLWCQRRGLSWHLDTVAKWFPDWAKNPKEFDNAKAGR